jgi:hypothetical protein
MWKKYSRYICGEFFIMLDNAGLICDNHCPTLILNSLTSNSLTVKTTGRPCKFVHIYCLFLFSLYIFLSVFRQSLLTQFLVEINCVEALYLIRSSFVSTLHLWSNWDRVWDYCVHLLSFRSVALG